MNLPFTTVDFREVFVCYNLAVGPAPLVLIGFAALAVIAVLGNGRSRHRIACGVLALLWFWSGLLYHVAFFAKINPAAFAFGALFLAQAVAVLWFGLRGERIQFEPCAGRMPGIFGAAGVGYALVIYPVLGFALGHRWPAMATFGAPCPVVLFTLGLFLWTKPLFPKFLLVAPMVWAVVGTSAALELEVYEDWALPVAGFIAGGYLLGRRSTPAHACGNMIPRDAVSSASGPKLLGG